jgi:hypothetical protein
LPPKILAAATAALRREAAAFWEPHMPDHNDQLGRLTLERDGLKAKVALLERKLGDLLAEKAAVRALADAGFGQKVQFIMLPHLLRRIRVQGANEKRPRASAIDTFGNNGMPLADLVAEFKRHPEFADLLSGLGRDDDRACRLSRLPPEANPFLKGNGWNVTQQLLLRKHVPALADYLKAEAKTAPR